MSHHQGVQSCASLNLLVVIHRYFVVCLVGVWQLNFEPGVCVRSGRTEHTPQIQTYSSKHTPNTRQNICESLRVNTVKHSSVLPDDGSHKIRNMSE